MKWPRGRSTNKEKQGPKLSLEAFQHLEVTQSMEAVKEEKDWSMRQKENNWIPSQRTWGLLAKIVSVKQWGTEPVLRGSKSEWKRKKAEERIDNSFERFNREGDGKNGPLRIKRGEFNKGQFLSTDGVHQSLSVHLQGCSRGRGKLRTGEERDRRSSKVPGKEAGHSGRRGGPWWGWRVGRRHSACSVIPSRREMREEWPSCQNKTLWMRRRANKGVPLDSFLFSQASTKLSHQLREQKSVRFEGKVWSTLLRTWGSKLKSWASWQWRTPFQTVVMPTWKFSYDFPHMVNTSSVNVVIQIYTKN